MAETTLTPARLWKSMTSEQRKAAALAFWQDEEATADQLQAALLISQQKKFRPKTVIGLDEDRKARHLASLPSLPDALAARALVTYHLSQHRGMMGAFLDALGIAHENGLIQEEQVRPDADKLVPAAQVLLERFPREDVVLYLRTLVCQDPDTWGALAPVVEGLTAQS